MLNGGQLSSCPAWQQQGLWSSAALWSALLLGGLLASALWLACSLTLQQHRQQHSLAQVSRQAVAAAAVACTVSCRLSVPSSPGRHKAFTTALLALQAAADVPTAQALLQSLLQEGLPAWASGQRQVFAALGQNKFGFRSLPCT